MTPRWQGLLLLPLALATACAGPTAAEQTATAERAAMAPLKAHYSDVVMGFDFHDTSVDVSIDLNAMISMDEDAEDALKAEALKQWRAAWSASHPHRHATLVLRLIDFQGHQQYRGTTAV